MLIFLVVRAAIEAVSSSCRLGITVRFVRPIGLVGWPSSTAMLSSASTAAVLSRHVGGQFHESLSNLGLNVRQLSAETLHPAAVHFRRARQTADEGQGLNEVVVDGLAQHGRNRLGDDFRPGRFDAEETVHAAGDVVAAVRFPNVAGLENQNAAALHRPGQQRPLIDALAIDDVRVVVLIDEADRGRRARRLADPELAVADFPQLSAG